MPQKDYRDTEIQQFLTLLATMSEQEKQAITHFDLHVRALYDHNTIISKILILSDSFKRENDEETRRRLHALVQKIKTDVLPRFKPFLEEETTDETKEEHLLLAEKEALASVHHIQFRDHHQLLELLKGNPQHSGLRAEISSLLREIEGEMRTEEVEENLIEHLQSILSELKKKMAELRDVLRDQSETIDRLESYLSWREDHFGRTDELDKIVFALRLNQETAEGLFRAEKEEVIDPFNKFLDQKRSLQKRVVAYRERRTTLSWKEMARDVWSMTQPHEVQEYHALLLKYKIPLDARAERFFGQALQSSVAVARKKHFSLQKFRRIAIFDQLTQAYSRYQYHLKCNEVLANYERRGKTFSLLSLDIDFFKSFNDTYGHAVGDTVLRFVSETIQRTIRKTDFLFRVGGEEFMVLLTETNREQAIVVAEKVLRSVEQSSLGMMEEENAKAIIVKDELKRRDRITISLGVAEFMRDGKDLLALNKTVDDLLYASKNRGRNRISYRDDAGNVHQIQ